MTPAAFAMFALSLPEAHEEPHFERRSFRIGKKIFATLTADGQEAMVRVAAADLIRSLLETHPKVFFSYGGWTLRNGSLGVHLRRAGSRMLEGLVVESWRSVASRRARSTYDAT